MTEETKEDLSFQKKTVNGKPNPKYIDLLDEDPKLVRQKWGCFSFITPSKILKNREMFYFESFVKQWETSTNINQFEKFVGFLSFKYKLKVNSVMDDYIGFITEEKAKLSESTIRDDFANYLDKNEEALLKQFNEENQFQTSILGFKSRGHFDTEEEAKAHAKKLQNMDIYHNIFVGPVGVWIAFDPEPDKTGDVQYSEEKLNQLHHEKQKNAAKAKEEFEERIRLSKKNAIEENMKLAEKTNNKLTQSLNEEGQLVGVNNLSEVGMIAQSFDS
jgi:hypothetical protein